MPDRTQYEIEEEIENEALDASEDDERFGGDLEIGDDERRMLELAQQEDDSDDIEDLGKFEDTRMGKVGKKR